MSAFRPLPEGCVSKFFSRSNLGKHGLKTGPNASDVVAWAKFSMAYIKEDIQKYGFYSEFHEIKGQFPNFDRKADPGEDDSVLVVSDANREYSDDGWVVCLTTSARDRWLCVIAEAEAEKNKLRALREAEAAAKAEAERCEREANVVRDASGGWGAGRANPRERLRRARAADHMWRVRSAAADDDDASDAACEYAAYPPREAMDELPPSSAAVARERLRLAQRTPLPGLASLAGAGGGGGGGGGGGRPDEGLGALEGIAELGVGSGGASEVVLAILALQGPARGRFARRLDLQRRLAFEVRPAADRATPRLPSVGLQRALAFLGARAVLRAAETSRQWFVAAERCYPSGRRRHSEWRAAAKRLTAKIAALAAEAEGVKDEAQGLLGKCLPMLHSAHKALNNLRLVDVVEGREWRRPPPQVLLMARGVCTLLQLGTSGNAASRRPRGGSDPVWARFTRWLRGQHNPISELINFDKDNMSDAAVERVRPLLEDERFTVEHMRRVSILGAALTEWVRAMVSYHDIAKLVTPMRRALQRLQPALEQASQELKTSALQPLDASMATNPGFFAVLRRPPGPPGHRSRGRG